MDLTQDIRLLTVRSPYAELFLHGKKIETRTRITHYRGLVLIQCGLVPFKWNDVEETYGREGLLDVYNMLYNKLLLERNLGEAIAIGKLVDCRPMNKSDVAKAMVKHSHTLYSWVFEDITPVVPFKIKGSQGMNLVKEEFKKLIILK